MRACVIRTGREGRLWFVDVRCRWLTVNAAQQREDKERGEQHHFERLYSCYYEYYEFVRNSWRNDVQTVRWTSELDRLRTRFVVCYARQTLPELLTTHIHRSIVHCGRRHVKQFTRRYQISQRRTSVPTDLLPNSLLLLGSRLSAFIVRYDTFRSEHADSGGKPAETVSGSPGLFLLAGKAEFLGRQEGYRSIQRPAPLRVAHSRESRRGVRVRGSAQGGEGLVGAG